jgi:P-type E1-E2 ATPase
MDPMYCHEVLCAHTWTPCKLHNALQVASIPVAIEVVTTTTLALGSRQLSAHGAIVTRLAAIEELAGMNMLCSDKTGTLTLNKMVIQVWCSWWHMVW